MAMTLSDIRTRALESVIRGQIESYLKAQARGKDFTRPCAWCGEEFAPLNRYHFFDKPTCRRAWYGGQFRPKARARRAS